MRSGLAQLSAGERAELAAALAAAGLPADDIAEPDRLFFQLRDGSARLGWGGLELFGSEALLRSVLVPEALRGTGAGRRLVEALACEAARRGADRLWLLTTTAEPFFTRLGFERVAREAAPAPLRASREFASLCPASAACMTIELAREPQA